MIKATINKVEIEVPEGTTILEAARSANFAIPTLCRHPDLPAEGPAAYAWSRWRAFPPSDGPVSLNWRKDGW